MPKDNTVLINTDEDDAAEIDALGDLQPHVEAAKKLLKSYDLRVKTLKEKHGGGDPEQERVASGNRHTMNMAQGTKERVVINMTRLIEILGEDTFLSICKVGMIDIDKYVPEHQKSEVLDSRRGGSRNVKFSRKI